MFSSLRSNFKNNSNGSRHKKQVLKSTLLRKNNMLKRLRVFFRNSSGRNITGKITVRHKGSGSKRKKFLNFLKKKTNLSVTIVIIKDLKKSALISLNFDLVKKKFWSCIAARNSCSGTLTDFSISTRTTHTSMINCVRNLPAGTFIYNVSSNFKNFCYAKSAGTSCMLLQKSKKGILMRLPSGKLIKIKKETLAFIGKVSNKNFKNSIVGKAGYCRTNNKRPTTRGVAMNPVDHPHGGNTSIGVHPKTPWGIPVQKKFKIKKYVKI